MSKMSERHLIVTERLVPKYLEQGLPEELAWAQASKLAFGIAQEELLRERDYDQTI